ncbi:MAG: TetR/AcrR family transcriptional regulator [Kibdelosporangium sp.]
MQSASLRVYGGVAGGERQVERRARLIEAGLELLGTDAGGPGLTVRGVCKQAGLAARYFYESFADRDALAIAVFDHVVSDIATTTLEAVKQARQDARARTRAALDNIVRHIGADKRRGRMLFSPALSTPVLVQRRVESAKMFARLLGGQAQDFAGAAGDARLELVTEFLVGGMAQLLTSWLNSSLDVSADDIVEHCTEIFLAVGRLG